MKICIYGAGAIGGYLGAKLTEIGADVTLIARGPHYEAIRQDGLRLRKDGKELVVYPKCVNTAEKAGKQDYIFVTLKAHSVLTLKLSIWLLAGAFLVFTLFPSVT